MDQSRKKVIWEERSEKLKRLDATLAMMLATRKPEATFTMEEIAELAGVEFTMIKRIERAALKKIKKKLIEETILN